VKGGFRKNGKSPSGGGKKKKRSHLSNGKKGPNGGGGGVFLIGKRRKKKRKKRPCGQKTTDREKRGGGISKDGIHISDRAAWREEKKSLFKEKKKGRRHTKIKGLVRRRGG